MILARTAALVFVGFAITGCGGGTGTGHSPAAAATTSGSSSTPVATDLSLPSGMKRIVVAKAGLSLGVDQTWLVTDTSKFNEPKYAPTIEKLARSQHLTADQVRLKMTRVEFLVSGPLKHAASRGNIEGGIVAGYADLPTADHLRAVFGALNIYVDAVTDIATPVGNARLAVTHNFLPSGAAVYAEVLYLDLHNGIADLTSSAASKDDAARVMAATVPTLRDVG